MPAEGDLILEMPPRGGGASTITAPGVLYTNDGMENPPATLGSMSVLPSAVSYYDGFFVSPTQILARATTFGPGFEGTPSVAMGDIDDDGVSDLVVGAGKGHAPEIVAYSGKASGGKYAFETELLRFEAFDSSAQGGASVAASSVDRRQHHRGVWARCAERGEDVPLGSAGAVRQGAIAVLEPTAPISDDGSGVSIAAGLVRFATRPATSSSPRLARAGRRRWRGSRLPALKLDRPTRSVPALGRTSASPPTTSPRLPMSSCRSA